MGKAPVGVAACKSTRRESISLLRQRHEGSRGLCNQAGIDAFFPILRRIVTLEEAMDPSTARSNMTASVEQVFRLL